MTDAMMPQYAHQQLISSSRKVCLWRWLLHAFVALAWALVADLIATSCGLAEDDFELVAANRRALAEAQFDQNVFADGPSRRILVRNGLRIIEVNLPSAVSARERMDLVLESEIQSVDSVCSLNDAQKKKLRLAGRGDIVRVFDQALELRRQCTAGAIDGQELSKAIAELTPQMTQGGLQGGLSLFQKTLRTTLTSKQQSRYRVQQNERLARTLDRVLLKLAQTANIEWSQTGDTVLTITERRKAGRRKVIEVLMELGDLTQSSDVYFPDVVLLEMDRLEDRLKPLLTAETWDMLQMAVAEAKQREPLLRKAGEWPLRSPDEDDQPSGATKE